MFWFGWLEEPCKVKPTKLRAKQQTLQQMSLSLQNAYRKSVSIGVHPWFFPFSVTPVFEAMQAATRHFQEISCLFRCGFWVEWLP